MQKIVSFSSKLSDFLDKQISRFVVLLILSLSILLGINVFYRYILNNSIYWSNEVARYLLVYIVFFGATMAHKHKAHIRIDIFYSKLSKKNQKIIEILISVLFILFWIMILIGCKKLLPLFMMQKTATLQIPFAVPFAALPISAIVWIIYCINDILKEVYKK